MSKKDKKKSTLDAWADRQAQERAGRCNLTTRPIWGNGSKQR